jgi:hypothetical protein
VAADHRASVRLLRGTFRLACGLVDAVDHRANISTHALIARDFLRRDVAGLSHRIQRVRCVFQPGQRLLRRVIRHCFSIGTTITEGLSNSEHVVETSEPPRGSTWVRGAPMRGVIGITGCHARARDEPAVVQAGWCFRSIGVRGDRRSGDRWSWNEADRRPQHE